MGSGFRRKGLLLNTVIAEFLFRASEIKTSATSRASGIRALARDNFKNRLSAEIADIFCRDCVVPKNSAMTVIESRSGILSQALPRGDALKIRPLPRAR